MYYPNVIYHVYNQSINFEPLFRNEGNYLFFLQKLRVHLLPVTDVLCYCLMPDHFHLQLIPKPEGCELATVGTSAGNHQVIHARFRTILSSYTRAFNNEHGRRGSLFRAGTKYKPAYADFLPENWEMREDDPFTRYIPYVRICFEYIHQNPVRARLVHAPEHWAFSSAKDYAGLREGSLCNYVLAEKLIGVGRDGRRPTEA
ncbi:putative transposase [Lewinella aquimaris]|uniref:Putative transposase n=1 Tax=Neolewinella aquimaris TaxID=1835722 RepID=A0A840E7Y5_9BACT|nr:hypothetical protein [Neolewinella aquimaris]MBB4079725.1 putative transposase [Neolewinella aquimaris]